MIDITVELCGAKPHKEAENHLDYLIRSGQPHELKADVRVICAKNTTTKRSCICIKHQIRWYMVVQFTWDKLERLNLTAEEYQSVKAHFMLNLDETGSMGSEGTAKLIGDSIRKN